MNLHEEDLFDLFQREIIQLKDDTRNQRWKYKCEQVVKKITTHEINLISPKDCIFQAVVAKQQETDVNIIQTINDLENAFYCISQYAINLCRDPHRQEYRIIKTYTGYYASNILSVMNGTDVDIIKSMGYEIKDGCENRDEFILRSPTKVIRRLAFELFLAQPYCRRVTELCQQVYSKYPMGAISYMLERDLKDLIDVGVENLCENWLYENGTKRTNSYHSYQHLHSNTDHLTEDSLRVASSVETTNIHNEYDTNSSQQRVLIDNDTGYYRENPVYESTVARPCDITKKKSSSVKLRVAKGNESDPFQRNSIGESTLKSDDHRTQQKFAKKGGDTTHQYGHHNDVGLCGNNTPTGEFKITYPEAFFPKSYYTNQ